ELHAHDRGARDTGHRQVSGRAEREDRLLERLQGARLVVGGAAPLLSRRRAVALAALLAALVLYGAVAADLWSGSASWDVVFFAFLLIPAPLSVIWLVLPIARARGTALVGLALVVLAVLLHLAGLGSLFNVAKLLAIAALGFAFLAFFEPPLA